MKKIILIAMILLTSACAAHNPNMTTRQKVIYGANIIVYTPLCLLYGICPDISEDE